MARVSRGTKEMRGKIELQSEKRDHDTKALPKSSEGSSSLLDVFLSTFLGDLRIREDGNEGMNRRSAESKFDGDVGGEELESVGGSVLDESIDFVREDDWKQRVSNEIERKGGRLTVRRETSELR